MPLSAIKNERVANYDTRARRPTSTSFATLHCLHFSKDGLVYVCDRGNDRVQVFTKQGSSSRSSGFIPRRRHAAAKCGGPGSDLFGPCGTVYNLAFSGDPQQNFVFVADGANDKVWIVTGKAA